MCIWNWNSTTALTQVSDISHAFEKNMAILLTLLNFGQAFDTISEEILNTKCKYLGFNTSLNF